MRQNKIEYKCFIVRVYRIRACKIFPHKKITFLDKFLANFCLRRKEAGEGEEEGEEEEGK